MHYNTLYLIDDEDPACEEFDRPSGSTSFAEVQRLCGGGAGNDCGEDKRDEGDIGTLGGESSSESTADEG